jgi:16S rRNA (guanine1516-N2)-methyltransferase
LIVTTSEKAPETTVSKAISLSEELNIAYVPRLNKTIRSLHERWETDEIIVVTPQEVRLMGEGQHPLFFHPSMALVRLKRLMAGSTDTLMALSGVSTGDIVLDCTAGLCSDALVFSYSVGVEGRVVAMEASPVLHAIVREGMRLYRTGIDEVDAAMRRIETVPGHHLELLREMEDNSADVVYFDPMFEKPVKTSSSIHPLRQAASKESLSKEAVKEATRVARKKVVLKDHRDSGQFDQLGFERVRASASSVAYGVIAIV